MSARRILLALALALAISGVATWGVSRRMTTPAPRIPSIGYAVPVHPVQPGDVLRAEDLQIAAWPGDHPIGGAYTRTADVVGREALYPLVEGQPVTEKELSAPGAGVGLASKVPTGMRAVALRSDEVVGVAGFLMPGSRVDVLVTYHAGSNPDPITATALQNVSVLAVGHEAEPDAKGKTSDVTIVTILLGPDDSERAVLASAQGQIHFVLRNSADEQVVSSAPVQLSRLTSAPARTKPAARSVVVPKPAPAKHEVEMVLGDQASVMRPAPQPEGTAR